MSDTPLTQAEKAALRERGFTDTEIDELSPVAGRGFIEHTPEEVRNFLNSGAPLDAPPANAPQPTDGDTFVPETDALSTDEPEADHDEPPTESENFVSETDAPGHNEPPVATSMSGGDPEQKFLKSNGGWPPEADKKPSPDSDDEQFLTAFESDTPKPDQDAPELLDVEAAAREEGIAQESAAQPASPKPTASAPQFKHIPPELRALPNWIMWRYEPPDRPDNPKWKKIPCNLNGRRTDAANRTSDWTALDRCQAAYQRGIAGDGPLFDGVGFCFDGEIGPDGYCLTGVDFDDCCHDNVVVLKQKDRINRLNTYTEQSPSGRGFHCIGRSLPLTLKTPDVEVYSSQRYFTFTGHGFRNIRVVDAELQAIAAEVRAESKAKNDAAPSTAPSTAPEPNHWFGLLTDEQKDEVVDHALGVLASKTSFLELEADGGNNDQWYRLTTAVARSGAPNAEDIFVKYAAGVKDADPEDKLREHFARCQKDPPSGCRGITVGTLLRLASEHGADFEQWRTVQRRTEPTIPISWDPTETRISPSDFFNIPHRQWIYGTYLLRGEVTIVASPGGVGKTAFATGIAIELAVGREMLGEKIWGPRTVLYITRELKRTEMMRRIRAFFLAHRLEEQPPERLYVIGKDDDQVQHISFLQTDRYAGTTLNTDGFAALETAIVAHKPDVLVLESLTVFCGENMNDPPVMARVMDRLSNLADKYECAILVIHHTRKGGERGDQEAVSGAASIVNMTQRTLMPVPMTADEAQSLEILPSESWRYFKLVDAKSNPAPKSAEKPWYRLHSVDILNPDQIFMRGDDVQAVVRAKLPLRKTALETASNQRIQRAIVDLIHRGKTINGEQHPYSPNITGAKNMRAILEDAMAAVTNATVPQRWPAGDLKAVVLAAITKMKADEWLYENEIPSGPFRRRSALYVDWQKVPWPKPTSTTALDSSEDAT